MSLVSEYFKSVTAGIPPLITVLKRKEIISLNTFLWNWGNRESSFLVTVVIFLVDILELNKLILSELSDHRSKKKGYGCLRCVLVLCLIEKRTVSMTNSLEPCWVFICICIPQNFQTIKEVSLLHRVTPVLTDDRSCDYSSCFLELFQGRNKKEETFVKCSQSFVYSIIWLF